MTSIDVYHKDITAVGAKAIAEVLKTNKTLTDLRLTANKIGDEGAKALAKALETNATLKKMSLTINSLLLLQIKKEDTLKEKKLKN